MSTERKKSPAHSAHHMIRTAEFAAQLFDKASLWDKVRATAWQNPEGAWELRIGSPHQDEQMAQAFEQSVRG